MQLSGAEEPGEAEVVNDKDLVPPTSEVPTWKRCAREENKLQRQDTKARTTQGIIMGATRQREEEGGPSLLPTAKMILVQVPSLGDCLGKKAYAS